ncbi:MAG: hypothetical protein AAB875_03530, partial [Patescibacteria group bacterium]
PTVTDVTKFDTSTPAPADLLKLTPEETELDKRMKTLMSKIEEGAKKPAFETEQQKLRGVPDLQKIVRDFSSQLKLTQLGAANIAQQIQAPGAGVTTEIDQRQKAEALRLNSVKALGIFAMLEMAKGNEATAQDAVDQAVKEKFGPLEAEIEALTKNAEIMKALPSATLSEKKRAQAVIDAQEKRKNLVKQAEESQKNIWDLAIKAIEGGADAATSTKIFGSGSKSEALKLATPFLKKAQDITATPGSIEEFKLVKGRMPTSLQELNEFTASRGAAGREPKAGTDISEMTGDLQAYAAQYSDTGKLPSPAELKLSGLNVGQVTAMAKQTPKPDGAVVSVNTGTKSSALSPAQEEGIIALSEIVRTTLPSLQDRFGKLSTAGVLGRVGASIYISQNRQDYRTFRADFLSKLLLARSGAAVTEEEYARYSALVPTELGNKFLGGISDKGGKTLTSLATSMKQTLDNKLNTQQLSIYGYSKIKVGGVERIVGETLEIGGIKYRVLPDGKLTDIL